MEDFETLRAALLDARNVLATLRIRAHDSRVRGHVCDATKAMTAFHDIASKGIREANKALGFPP